MTKTPDESALLTGYARVSTADQSVTFQIEALVKAGVPEERIYSESASGSKKTRPELTNCLRALQAGDTLVVWKLDRIARSMTHLLELLEGLEAREVKFRSLTEGVETQTPAGRLILHVLAALAQFERDLIRERSRAGVAAALERGVRFGARPKLKEKDMPDVWRKVHEEGMSHAAVGKLYKVSDMTIGRRLKKYEAEQNKPKRAKRNP